MYELGAVGDVANLLFSIVSIGMAHALYTTPRSRRQTFITWALIYLFLIVGTTPLSWLLPNVSYERASMLAGFCGIFAYMYLFPQIPVAQRIFTYFFVDTTMNLVVLFARISSVLTAPYLPIHPDLLFAILYIPSLIGFFVLFYRKLRKIIVDGLRLFHNHLTILTIFSASGYIILLLLVDPWAVWNAMDIWDGLAWYGLILLIVLGYVLSFRILSTLKRQIMVEQNVRFMEGQMNLLERYYSTLARQMEQVRIYNHDMRYHFTALSGLCMENNMEGIREYVTTLVQGMPDALPKKYCEIGGVNAILEYYDNLCRGADIRFVCRINISGKIRVKPVHLSIILGNAIQNGMEAVQELEDKEKHYLDVSAVMSGRRLVISVRNPSERAPMGDEDGNYISTKTEPGHGFGLSSIREAVRLYDGWCKTDWEDGIFTLQVVLQG